MTEAKFDIDKFNRAGDFGSWRIKMRALLIQHGCEAALEGLPGLETLYMTKSLANKLYLNQKLYTFYMSAGRKISEHIHEFKKIVLDLANIDVKFEDEDLALLLLTTLPASYEHFVDTLLYGWEALTLEDVIATLNSKEIKERSKTKGDDGEGLYDHLKRNSSKNNHKKSTGYVKKDDQPSSIGSTYDDFEVMSAEALLDWIMDSGCSYHMTPRYWQGEGTTELWVKFCVTQCQSGKVKVINGSRVVLSRIQRDNCVYSLDGHAMASELNASVEEKDSLAQGVKGYRLYRLDDESPKIVTSRNVVFNESVMYKDTLKDSGGRNDGNDEDAAYAVFYAAAEGRRTHEPLTYQEAVACEDNYKWKASMKEKMDSLRKKKTWELVDHPAGQKLTVCLLRCKSKAEDWSTSPLLKKDFDMKELGNQRRFMYAIGWALQAVVKDCPVRDCDVKRMSKVPYANAVGSLMYLMVCTRPDIAYAVSVVSRYLANPGKNHWEAVKWILKYLRGTANVGLVYGTNRGNHVDVTGFVDSDYAKDPDKEGPNHGLRIFSTGMCCKLEGNATTRGGSFNYRSGVYGSYGGCKEAIWLRGLLEELGIELNTVEVNCDNQGTIHLWRNHVFHERTKHINVRYHFIREVLEAKTVKVLKVGIEYNVADALAKVVPGLKLQHFLELLNVGVG
ncbi:hypothetical protein Tco_0722619 [Tanacetum coccineum]